MSEETIIDQSRRKLRERKTQQQPTDTQMLNRMHEHIQIMNDLRETYASVDEVFEELNRRIATEQWRVSDE